MIQIHDFSFLLRDAMHHAVVWCLSVCLFCLWIELKRINMFSNFFHHEVAALLKFFRTIMAIF